MALIEVEGVGNVGVIRDEKAFRLSPEVWSDVLNIRCVDGEVWPIGGRAAVFGALPDSPVFLIPVATSSQFFWLWASLTDIYVYNGINHTNITRAVGGDYTATSPASWNGVVFAGVPILNSGSDIPQAWLTPTVATKMVDLPNWPTDYRARVMRALGPYLVAAHITKTATVYPHMVKWSHPADPGSVPASWDQTDPNVDAGEADLPDVNSGVLLEALNLRGQLYLYKEAATWRMRYVGGTLIFAFDTFLETAGLLAPRCVAITGEGQRHFMVSQDDVLIHNGATADPLLAKKMRRYLFNQIDTANYGQSFVYNDPEFKEMVFCYPASGSTVPNMALIWNHETGAITEAEIDFVAAATGALQDPGSDKWNTAVGTWASYTGPWSSVQRRRTLAADKVGSRLVELNTGSQFNGVDITTRAQRTAIGLIGRKRDGSPIVDFNRRKLINRVWPRIQGGPVEIRIGAQDSPEGPVRWTAKVPFNPDTQKFVDLIVEGAAIAIEFSTAANVSYKIEGYKLETVLSGGY